MKIVIGYKRRGDKALREVEFSGSTSYVRLQAYEFIFINQSIHVDFIRHEQEQEDGAAKSFRTSSAV